MKHIEMEIRAEVLKRIEGKDWVTAKRLAWEIESQRQRQGLWIRSLRRMITMILQGLEKEGIVLGDNRAGNKNVIYAVSEKKKQELEIAIAEAT